LLEEPLPGHNGPNVQPAHDEDGQESDTGSPPGFFRKSNVDAASKLQAFADSVRCKLRSPLAVSHHTERPAITDQPQLPKRSERLTKNPLATIKSSKGRGGSHAPVRDGKGEGTGQHEG
jgi:hypothetical protein